MDKWDKDDKIYHAKQEIVILEGLLKDAKCRLSDVQGYNDESWWYMSFLNWMWEYLNK
tara:strand:- start:2575 stop:2748 length:174 start_codon:yes stop_codon:yes gene_type:complete